MQLLQAFMLTQQRFQIVPIRLPVKKKFIYFSFQDEELLSTLEDLQHIKMPENINVSNRIQGYFSSDTVFDLSKKVLSETEMKVIAKRLDFAPIQNNIMGPN